MKIARGVFILALLVILCGCAPETPPPQSQDRVSTIPWNRPERWEGQGPLGGFNQETR
jgi:hypothetical protein